MNSGSMQRAKSHAFILAARIFLATPAVLWRAYPDEWVVATKPKLGPPKQIASLSSRPSTETIDAAIEGARGSGGLLDAVGLGNVF